MSTLPGAWTPLIHIGSCGHGVNSYGVGSISISASKPCGYAFDIGKLYFASPTVEQYNEALSDYKARGSFDIKSGGNAYAQFGRRMSFKQAQWLQQNISTFLQELLKEGIPPDDELQGRERP